MSNQPEPIGLDTAIALFNAANDPNVSEVSRDAARIVLEGGWWHTGLALVAEVRRLRERELKLRCIIADFEMEGSMYEGLTIDRIKEIFNA